MSRLEAITPRVPVSDIDGAVTFYTERLGFTLGWKWGEPATHANVCRDSVALDLIASPKGVRSSAMAYIQVAGVDELHAELQGRGVPTSGLADRDYGMRDFEVVDPFGNRIAFGQPLVR